MIPARLPRPDSVPDFLDDDQTESQPEAGSGVPLSPWQALRESGPLPRLAPEDEDEPSGLVMPPWLKTSR